MEVDIITSIGFGRASAPAGASVGKAEVSSYPKGGVNQAIKNVEGLITPELIGMNADMQEEIDLLLHEIDGTESFEKIGGNAAYAVSLATAEAAASSYGVPLFQHLAGYLANKLPYPLGNILGGGRHVHGRALDIQELLVLPLGARNFSQAARANTLVHQKVGSFLKSTDITFTGGKGDEGAWAARVENEDALKILTRACEEVSNELGANCKVGIDMAASTLWSPKEKCYVYDQGKVKRNSGEQMDFMLHLMETYGLAYVEDPFHEGDFGSFAKLNKKTKKCLICGDDLFTTNKQRLDRGIRLNAANAVIIKTNQVGTLTDAWETTKKAKEARCVPIMSHRSGETNDTHIAHLAVAFGCPIIKTGVIGGSRVSKINELMRIEETLRNRAEMAVVSI